MYIICKLLYITIFAVLSAAPPYIPLYYHDVLGFSSNQIGFVLAIAPFIQSVSCPLWSVIVDKNPRLHGKTMAITSFVGSSSLMAIMAIGHCTQLNFLKLSNVMLVTTTSVLALAFAFFTMPNMALVDSAVMKILGPNKLLYGEQRLWGSVSAGLTILIVGQLISLTGNLDMMFYVFGISTLLFILTSFFTNTTSFYEHIIYTEEQENRIEIDQVLAGLDDRLTIVASTDNVVEKLLDKNRAPANYSSISNEFYNIDSQYVTLFKGDSITSGSTIREEEDETLDKIGTTDISLSISRVLSLDQSITDFVDFSPDNSPPPNVFRSVRVLTFLITALLFGFTLSILVNFLFLFLSRDLHMPANWIGWTGPTTGITELLCFCFSKQLTEALGVTNMILIAHVATIARCLIYTILTPDSFFTNVTALLLQTLHGIGFGIFWATAVSEMDSFFPADQRSVAQGILGALHFGLGAGLGALTGGYLYEYTGPIWMFRTAAAISAVNMVVFYVGRLDRFK